VLAGCAFGGVFLLPLGHSSLGSLGALLGRYACFCSPSDILTLGDVEQVVPQVSLLKLGDG
jgi:hypothetical protein